MAHIPLMMGGDGGADLDLITIVSADVRKGKTYVDTDGNAQKGTMAEKGAATYYGQNYDQVIAANQYLTGNQTIFGDGNLQPWNIRKGVSIFGRAGTFQGWVDGDYNIFLDGNVSGTRFNGQYTNYVNVGSTISFATNELQPSAKGVYFTSPVSLSGYGKLFVRYSTDSAPLSVGVIRAGGGYGDWEVSCGNRYSINGSTYEIALDIYSVSRQAMIFIGTNGYSTGCDAAIHRIILGRPA